MRQPTGQPPAARMEPLGRGEGGFRIWCQGVGYLGRPLNVVCRKKMTRWSQLELVTRKTQGALKQGALVLLVNWCCQGEKEIAKWNITAELHTRDPSARRDLILPAEPSPSSPWGLQGPLLPHAQQQGRALPPASSFKYLRRGSDWRQETGEEWSIGCSIPNTWTEFG